MTGEVKIDKSKERVRAMFDSIAPKYDFLNHFLSLNIDKIWRKKVRRIANNYEHSKILDIATGTGDLAIELTKTGADKITGVDISPKMIEIARKKVNKRNLSDKIDLKVADALNLPFEDDTFDIVTCAFGVRNFEDLDKGLKEINRILKPNGVAIILEFSQISNKLHRKIFNFYFYKILPFLGKIFSKNKSAYTYLPVSVNKFPYGKVFAERMKNNGFYEVNFKKLSNGIASIYIAQNKKV